MAPGARPGRPVSVVHGGAAGGGPGTLSCPRLLVEVGEGAEASLVETFGADGGAPSLVHAVTEVHLAPGARFVHAVVNSLGPRVRANLVQRARLERGAELTAVSVGLGGEVVKVDAEAVLHAAWHHLDPDRLLTVIVGDRERVSPALDRAGLGPVTHLTLD